MVGFLIAISSGIFKTKRLLYIQSKHRYLRLSKLSLFLFVALIPLRANAQSLGCYIDTGTLNLYNAGFLCSQVSVVPQCGTNYFSNYAAFGWSFAEQCKDLTKALNDFDSCVASYNAAVATAISLQQQVQVQFNNSLYNSDRTEEWKAYAQYLQGLEQRLRKKCGSKCKKIK